MVHLPSCVMMGNQVVAISSLGSCSEDIDSTFWQFWQQHQDYLYRCCLKWMGENPTEAEDALSLAMLLARDKFPVYAEKITSLKAWLTRLTHNLCVDIHRERCRRAMEIESIEDIAVRGDSAAISSFDSPEDAILRHELGRYIRRAIDALCSRLRTPFILRYYHQFSYQDIAQQLALSLDNVYKRIQQAREFLQKRLRRYLLGLDDSVLDSSEMMISDSQAAMTMARIGETINYQVTATCLETLPHAWYRSPSPLGWS